MKSPEFEEAACRGEIVDEGEPQGEPDDPLLRLSKPANKILSKNIATLSNLLTNKPGSE